ncbi:hypothetical protein [Halobellus sp. H-GB7]|uniref:hypothetical protein n=1 Tax=Halobellus sp. H-GB7 TaxID=3069756 RepID=UPI0027B41606|nr:hypothetical protein [Halobellus sp. H-GB7]MDQ2053665.1 hypothetical protein [Halobellus sp. H-GB7]
MPEKTNRNEITTSGGFEWRSVPDSNSGSERSHLALVAFVAVTVVFGSVGMLFMSAPASASTSFTANDVSATTANGKLNELTVAPNGTVSYSGLEQEPSGVTVTVEVKGGSASDWKEISSKSHSATGLSGEVSYDFSETRLLQDTSMKPSDFRATDGNSGSTDVQIRVTAVVEDAGPNGDDVTTTSTNSFAVTVENTKAGAGVGGKANAGASGPGGGQQ